jgi:hypothetical protein
MYNFYSFLPTVLEEWTSPMSFITSRPLFSLICLFLSSLKFVDQHSRRDMPMWLYVFLFKQQPFSFNIGNGHLYLGINNSFILSRFWRQQLNTGCVFARHLNCISWEGMLINLHRLFSFGRVSNLSFPCSIADWICYLKILQSLVSWYIALCHLQYFILLSSFVDGMVWN